MLGRDGGRDEGIVAGGVMARQGQVVEPSPALQGTAPWQKGRYAKPIRLLPLALEVCVNDRACWRNVLIPFWRYEMGGSWVLEKRSCWDWGALGRVPWVEQAPCLAEMGCGVRGILVAQAGEKGK